MQVKDTGHAYLLNTLDGAPAQMEVLRFVKREGPGYPGNVGSYPGTTSQEVLRALIQRARYVNNQEYHVANTIAIANMRTIVWLYEMRAANRHGRPIDFDLEDAEYGPLCGKCGHIGCSGECHSD